MRAFQVFSHVVGGEALSVFNYEHAFNDVAEFTHVPRPIVLRQELHRVVGNPEEGNFVFLG
jgi:hypothetical protein